MILKYINNHAMDSSINDLIKIKDIPDKCNITDVLPDLRTAQYTFSSYIAGIIALRNESYYLLEIFSISM